MIDLPPAAYSHAPDLPVTVWIEEQWRVQQACGSVLHDDSIRYRGCAFRLGHQCFIYVAPVPEFLSVIMHEIGHCNGWPFDHRR